MTVPEAIAALHKAGYIVKLFGEADIRQEIEQRGGFEADEVDDIIIYAQASDAWNALLDGYAQERRLISDAVSEGIETMQALKE